MVADHDGAVILSVSSDLVRNPLSSSSFSHQILKRVINENDFPLLSNALRAVNWDLLLQQPDPEIAFSTFHDLFTNKFDSVFPVKIIKPKKSS